MDNLTVYDIIKIFHHAPECITSDGHYIYDLLLEVASVVDPDEYLGSFVNENLYEQLYKSLSIYNLVVKETLDDVKSMILDIVSSMLDLDDYERVEEYLLSYL